MGLIDCPCKDDRKSISGFRYAQALAPVRFNFQEADPSELPGMPASTWGAHQISCWALDSPCSCNDQAVTQIRPMKGRRRDIWDSDLGLAILAATQYPPHTQRVLANYMGVSRQRVQQIEKKALRKLRIRLMRQPQVWEVLRDHIFKKC